MKTTKFMFNGKQLGMLSVGCMRFAGRAQAGELIPHCAENGALFLDTSPMYLYESEKENCETWVGGAIRGIREKVILGAKCSPGNGGDGIGQYDMPRGFSVQTAGQVRQMIEQSLKRLGVDYFDIYQLWTVSDMPVYKSAFKKGGWIEGVMKAKEEGLLKHLGMTTHAGNDFIKMAADEGIFEMIIAPFNIIDSSRLEGLEYAMLKNIAAVAMNPLGGGLLAKVNSGDLGLRYVNAFGISALAGISDIDQARRNTDAMRKPVLSIEQAEELRRRFTEIYDAEKFKCASCGYCMPCPQDIDVPGILGLWNQVTVLKLYEKAGELRETLSKSKIADCTKCGLCEEKCPNRLEITKMLEVIGHERRE